MYIYQLNFNTNLMYPKFKEHLSEVLAEINDVVWCVDATSLQLLYSNEACYGIWGYTPNEMKEDRSIFFNSIHPDDLNIWKEAISMALTHGRSQCQFRVKHKDGDVKYIQGESIFKKGNGELPDTITGIATDITQIIRINETITKKNKELEDTLLKINNLENDNSNKTNLLQSYQNAIDTNIICSITDHNGIITYVNDNFCNISQYSREELIGKSHRIINSKFHSRQFFETMWKEITNGKMWMGEIRNRAKDGSYYWVDSVIMPMRNSDNSINGYLSLRILINDRKKMEEEKEVYLKSIENMLNIVSHEIRKPITNCQGILYLLQNNMPTNDKEYREYISYLANSTQELDNYSRKLNDYLETNIVCN
jgi:PAS domain S-box-containing protein